MNEITARLENWRYDPRGIIWGNIFDDVRKRWREGQVIHTSYIFDHDVIRFAEGDLVYTLNSVYLLGKPLEE